MEIEMMDNLTAAADKNLKTFENKEKMLQEVEFSQSKDKFEGNMVESEEVFIPTPDNVMIEPDNDENMTVEQDEELNRQTQFLELLKWEEESKAYLDLLTAEESGLRQQVDAAVKETHGLLELQSSLEAKIEAQRQARVKLGLEELTKRNTDRQNDLDRVKEEIDTIRLETLTKSTKMLQLQVEDTANIANRLKQYRDPKSVAKSLKATEDEIVKVRSEIEQVVEEQNRIIAEMAGLDEQKNMTAILQQIGSESKDCAETWLKSVAALNAEIATLEREVGSGFRQYDHENDCGNREIIN
ncbi:uncharacterized protein LOC110853276 [Folsomia candida]|uniref:Uncharacterized protein n=1 Tax=Folsomia candida TaxID=158441 RepID=A0A226E264_FOLCA|nr:uncharacterized protein LOC110853276 [Folsomia candida]XP_035710216.1 uncharacterized protein LOC110853276 [Folsomia candida]OXA51077.1 hypothetical protein Fcan01_14423 [Folsomia candida]